MVQLEPATRDDPRPVGWCLVALSATGPDTSLDGVFRVRALRRADDGTWERFDRYGSPFDGTAGERATARMVREHGVSRADLEGAPGPEVVFEALDDFLGSSPVLAVERGGFEAWYGRYLGDERADVLGLDELRGLLAPGRALDEVRVPRSPEELAGELARIVTGLLGLDPPTLRAVGAGLSAAFAGLVEADPEGARRLELALRLVERPSEWAGAAGELFGLDPGLRDEGLPLAVDPDEPLGGAGAAARRAIDALRPRWSELAVEWASYETVPVRKVEEASWDEDGEAPELPLADEGLRRLDDAFQVHLARDFAAGGTASGYREGQHLVAREVAATLGQRELLLVHAPTGTGKTLAYLVPVMLWAAEHGVRVGVSTYTRALQEQAMDREVPRALAALARAGLDEPPRVSLLKGRQNYLCWRALCLHAPSEHDGPETWLAWTALLLFARRDPEGDLDRFPRRAALFGEAGRGVRRSAHRIELDSLLRAVRADKGCCHASADRETCAAEVARFRAERSHVVITNHSFALARQSFFERVVFDECEHLHDQAHAAFSHSVSLAAVRDLLERLRQPGRPTSRAPLDRLVRVAPPGSVAEEALETCVRAWYAVWGELDRLEGAVGGFKRWRAEAARQRERRDAHSLLREFVAPAGSVESDGPPGVPAPEAAALVEARRALHGGGSALEQALCGLTGQLDSIPARGLARVRRALELLRAELVEVLDALDAWMPLDEGAPRFRRDTFHEIEEDARGRDVLAARVLLPNEFLGRHYYPQLAAAVLISATTWLRGGFDCAKGYLGLDRAAQPDDDEERPPCRVRAFRAPDPFDYGRVLVCVPDDAPEYGDKRAFDRYVRGFVAHLAERTRGRVLVLFTNAEDARRTGQELAGFFRARRIPLWFQNMPGHGKEELGRRFRDEVDSVLLGVDTFWYGADFPGETLEYLVIVKLPYGVPDAYHAAQCAALGTGEQRRRIYMPRALAKLRQGFGRLMRRESDRGCVFVLDGRVLQPRHAAFLRELPLAGEPDGGDPDREWSDGGAELVVDGTEACIHHALAHMNMLADVRRRGLEEPFPAELARSAPAAGAPGAGKSSTIPAEDLPYRS